MSNADRYPSLAERLIANSVPDPERSYNGTPCWRWIGASKVNRTGERYGTLCVRAASGPAKGQPRTLYAHRESIRHLGGRRLRKGQVAMHLCNFTLCINPEHLKGGTQRTNVRQCVRDGRHKTPFRRKDNE